MSSKTAIFLCGYQPGMIKATDRLATKTSQAPDILHIGPKLGVTKVRQAVEWCSVAPIHQMSKSRTLVINMESIAGDAQSALLKILEEPPKTATFILTKSSIQGVLTTVLSRCKVIEFPYPGYGKSLKDLTESGMDIQLAAHIASMAEKGYSITEVPSEQDFSNAKMLLDAGKTKDIEMGINVSATFNAKTVMALRSLLVEAGQVGVIGETYRVTNPQDTAILVLNSMVSKHD